MNNLCNKYYDSCKVNPKTKRCVGYGYCSGYELKRRIKRNIKEQERININKRGLGYLLR